MAENIFGPNFDKPDLGYSRPSPVFGDYNNYKRVESICVCCGKKYLKNVRKQKYCVYCRPKVEKQQRMESWKEHKRKKRDESNNVSGL